MQVVGYPVGFTPSRFLVLDSFFPQHYFSNPSPHPLPPPPQTHSGVGYQELVRVAVFAVDGTVSIAHSGTEIGQGIDTKVAQCVSYALKIPMEKIVFGECASDVQPNTTTTGGSATSEVCCQAALNGCKDLLARLAPYAKEQKAGATEEENFANFAGAAAAAAAAGVCLAIDGWSAPAAEVEFQYYVYVAAATVVELDCLSGEVQVLSTDIQYDCGSQLNADVDIGQIEGGFIMGLGYYLSEDVVFDDKTGWLKSNGTWEYKPPMALDIPAELNVRLLIGSPNNSDQNVLRSKATGEPPLIASASVFFAVREAILVAQDDGVAGSGEKQGWSLIAPATLKNRIIALGDTISSKNFVL